MICLSIASISTHQNLIQLCDSFLALEFGPEVDSAAFAVSSQFSEEENASFEGYVGRYVARRTPPYGKLDANLIKEGIASYRAQVQDFLIQELSGK